MARWGDIQALTFDVFGTILDLGGSLQPAIREFLALHGPGVDAERFWDVWRGRQRIEQYQDSLLLLGHSGYLATARRALVYTCALLGVKAGHAPIDDLMGAWQFLSTFADVPEGLDRLAQGYRLVVLSNGEPEFLRHLVDHRIGRPFDAVISASDAGAFKPHPAVYRRAAAHLGLEVGQCMMVSSNSFDVMGARACGMRGAFVNRYALPYEDSPFLPDVITTNFDELADEIL